jgi:uncharacterized membrane protein YjdF
MWLSSILRLLAASKRITLLEAFKTIVAIEVIKHGIGGEYTAAHHPVDGVHLEYPLMFNGL